MRKSIFVFISVVLIAGAAGLQIAQAGNSNGDIAFTNGRSFSTIPNLVTGHATCLILGMQMLVAP